LSSAVAVVKSDISEIAVLRRAVIVSRGGESVVSEAVPEAIVALIAPVWTLIEERRSLELGLFGGEIRHDCDCVGRLTRFEMGDCGWS